MGARDTAQWCQPIRNEAGQLLASLDPEALTRCLVTSATSTGTSSPGWRLDTQGYITNPPAYNIQLQPNRDMKKCGRNRSSMLQTAKLHSNSAACIIVAKAFAQIDSADMKNDAQRVGQKMKDALLLSFEKSSGPDSTGVVKVHIDGAGVIRVMDEETSTAENEEGKKPSGGMSKKGRGRSCSTFKKHK